MKKANDLTFVDYPYNSTKAKRLLGQNVSLVNPDVVVLLAQTYAEKGKAFVQITVPGDCPNVIRNALTATRFRDKVKMDSGSNRTDG